MTDSGAGVNGEVSRVHAREWRGAAAGEYRGYDVSRWERRTALDVVTCIRRYFDPTLACRFDCRIAAGASLIEPEGA